MNMDVLVGVVNRFLFPITDTHIIRISHFLVYLDPDRSWHYNIAIATCNGIDLLFIHADVEWPNIGICFFISIYQSRNQGVDYADPINFQYGLRGQTELDHRFEPSPPLRQTSRWRVQVVHVQRRIGHLAVGTDQIHRLPVVWMAGDGGEGPQRSRERVQEPGRAQSCADLPGRGSRPIAL